MCIIVPTKWRCDHPGENEIQHCPRVQERLDQKAPAGSFTPCTIVSVPDPQTLSVSPWKCKGCHEEWKGSINEQWEAIWKNVESELQEFPDLIEEVSLMFKGYDDTFDHQPSWNDNTGNWRPEINYDLYQQRLDEIGTEMAQYVGKQLLGNEKADEGK